jgi:hypothetical protein
MIILNERHLLDVLREYADYFNLARSHQGFGQRIPVRSERESLVRRSAVVAIPVLGGLHHDYRAAA